MSTIRDWCDKDILGLEAGATIYAGVRENFENCEGGHKCKLCGDIVKHPRAAAAHLAVHHKGALEAGGPGSGRHPEGRERIEQSMRERAERVAQSRQRIEQSMKERAERVAQGRERIEQSMKERAARVAQGRERIEQSMRERAERIAQGRQRIESEVDLVDGHTKMTAGN